ncbi:MAG: MFS transporter [Jatrophihabitans sp.]
MTSPVHPAGKAPGLWRHRDFRRLWIGETVSQFGSTISTIALPLVAILVVHATTFEVGLLTACETAAFLLVGLPAGALVDRMPTRPVLIVGDLVRVLALGSIPAAYALAMLSIGQLYLVALVVGVATVFFDVAYQSYLPELIGRADLVNGNAKLQASESVAQIAGPGLGGLLIQVLTSPYAIIVDAATFLWSAAWIARIRTRPEPPVRRAGRNLREEIGEGLRFVLGNRLLRPIAMCTGVSNLFSSIGGAVFLVLLARSLRLSPGLIGALTATAAIGGVLGSLLAGRIARRIGQGPAIWLPTLLGGPLAFVQPFVRRDWTLGLLTVSLVFYWAAVVVYNITQVSFRQALCPPELLGRMNATMRFLVWGTLPIGGVIGGALGGWLGVRPTLFIAAVGGALAFLPVFLSPLRRMRELPVYAETALQNLVA